MCIIWGTYQFHSTIVTYLQSVRIKDEATGRFHRNLSQGQNIKCYDSKLQTIAIKQRLAQIEKEIPLLIYKIKMLHSEVALQALEADIEKLKAEKEALLEKEKAVALQTKKDNVINNEVKRSSDRIPEIIINDHSEVMKRQLFEILFVEYPTYDDLVNKTALLNPDFELAL